MEHKIIVAGIGPGAPEYLVPVAKKYIDTAGVLLGSRRALDTFAKPGTKTMAITGDIEAVLDFIKEECRHADVVVMVSGDPGYYSLLAALRNVFPISQLQVIPGISSMQLAFARLALPWQMARLLSLHGRGPDGQDLHYQKGAVLGILTDTAYTSQAIARLLLDHGWPSETKVYCCARLSYEDEEIVAATLGTIVTIQDFSHCIMVVTA